MLRKTCPSLLFRFTPVLAIFGKPTKSHPKRQWHNRTAYEKRKGHLLTARPRDEMLIKPSYPAFQEDVDKRLVVPTGQSCMQCKKEVDTFCESDYVWIPSGDAALPHKNGYLFHYGCFRCIKCGFRFYNNKFSSKDCRAECLSCALGKERDVPNKFMYSPIVEPGIKGSRRTGRFFPRHQHQIDFLHDADS